MLSSSTPACRPLTSSTSTNTTTAGYRSNLPPLVCVVVCMGPPMYRLAVEISGGTSLLDVSLYARRQETLSTVGVSAGTDHTPIHVPSSAGLTVPLLTTASGEKLGKSSGNAVWISGSSYQLYQAMVQVGDQEVETLLCLLTLLPLEEIRSLMDTHSVSAA